MGAAPTPPGCDGLHTPCRYAQLGAVQVDLAGMLAGPNVSRTFATQEGSVPAVWIDGDPAPMAAQTRGLERAVAQLRLQDPYTGTRQPIVRYLADRQEMALLHMVSADQARTPSFALFTQSSYFVSGAPAACCATVDSRHMSNADPAVNTTWLALAGPGVARRVDPATWAEQADIRPTMLALVGLQDGYVHDGRVLSAALQPEALPPGVRDSQAAYESVAGQLKQLDAPAGRVGMLSLAAATRAAAASSAGDAEYRSYVARMEGFSERRQSLADTMRAGLEGAAFGGRALDEKTALALTDAAGRLMAEMARA